MRSNCQVIVGPYSGKAIVGGVFGGTASWTPAALGGKLLSWVSANEQTSDSQSQPQWQDHSGNSRTLSGSTTARTPTFVKHGGNGSFVMDGVANDTSGDHVISDASWTDIKYIAMLCKYRGSTFTDFDCLFSSNNASPTSSIILGNTSAPSTAFLSLSPNPSFWKNGTSQAYTTAGSGPMNNYDVLEFQWASAWTQKLRVGGQVSQPTRYWPGEIVEMIVLNDAPTAGEQAAIQAYLSALRVTTAWSNKAVAWCGTSVPAGGNGAASYPHRVGAMLRIKRFDNNSQGSSRVVYTGSSSGASGYLSGTGAENTGLGVASTGSYETKCIGYDHVIIDHGLNDYNTTMGTAGDSNMDRAEFTGALGYLIDAIRTANASTQITLVTPATLYSVSGTIVTQMTNVRQAILDVAGEWGTNVIDLTTLLGYGSGDNATRFPDGTHPNALAEGEIAPALTTALQSITP